MDGERDTHTRLRDSYFSFAIKFSPSLFLFLTFSSLLFFAQRTKRFVCLSRVA